MNDSHQCDMPYSAVNMRQLLRQGCDSVSLSGWFHPMWMSHLVTSLQEQNGLNSRDTFNYLHGAEAFSRNCQLCSYSRTTRMFRVSFLQLLFNGPTSRKVAGSILDEVIGFFSWPNPSGRTRPWGLRSL
jgi:hypothetical protein